MIPLVLAYLGAIVAANLALAAWGPAVAPLNALVLIAFDLATRDRAHAAWAGPALWPRMLALIAAGGVVSSAMALLTTAGPPPEVVRQIAMASCAAFAAAGLADAAVFAAAGRLPWLARANLSNVAGALADSLVFGWLLQFPAEVVALQIAAKVLGGVVWSYILRPRRERAAAHG